MQLCNIRIPGRHALGSLLSLSLGIALLPACGGPSAEATAKTVSNDTAAIVADFSNELVEASTTLQSMDSLKAVGGAFERINGAFEGVVSEGPQSPQGGLEPSGGEGMDAEQMNQEIDTFIRTKLFPAEAVEEMDGNTAIFLLDGNRLCGDDLGCAASLDALEVRIAATPVPPKGVDLKIMVGAARHSPVTLELRDKAIGIELDLAGIKGAIEHAESAVGPMGEDGEAIELPSVMVGTLHYQLDIKGDQHLKATMAVTQKLQIEGTTDAGDIKVAIDVADPLASLEVDGVAATMSVIYDLAAVDLSAPAALVFDDPQATGVLSAHLGGLSYELTLSENDEVLQITDIGFGTTTTTLKLDNDVLFSLDLNQSAGRSFALHLEPTSAGDSAYFNFDPKFDLQVAVDFSSLSGEDLPPTESMGIDLDNGSEPASVLPVTDGLKVVAGQLTLSSSLADAALVVPEGQCLTARDPGSPRPGESHPILQLLEAAACN